MTNKDENGMLDDDKLYRFLTKSIAFIWTYAFYNPGVNALRTPIYDEMINIINGVEVTFDKYRFDKDSVKQSLLNFSFYNRRPITKSMLAWWAFTNEQQAYLSLEQPFEIEHIYAKNRQDVDGNLIDRRNIERLGNKSLLEKSVNIRVSDFRFEDKVKKTPIDITSLSSGEKQLFILLAESLLQNKSSQLFITDEPELSLHISWQRIIIEKILEINPNAQIIVATHSPEIAGKFPNNIINMSKITYYD
jgi:hypothetical protein